MDKKSMIASKSLLIMIHCEQHTGYAVGVLEYVFKQAAIEAGYNEDHIFWSYSKVTEPRENIIQCRFNGDSNYDDISTFISQKGITRALAFDLAYPADILPALYKSGITNIVSYWGASMSSPNGGFKLFLKKIEWSLRKYKPHTFIFESEAMRLTATHGRGVPHKNTHVIPLGVDTTKFFPAYQQDHYAHKALCIPMDRKIIFYSGHMEERKGVRIIIQAAIELIDKLRKNNIHFVICGNKNNEADPYISLLKDTQAAQHVTFAGYRNDIPELMRSAAIGVIASTGWDSFTMSSVEMMASGLPMIVSKLQGLGETIEHNSNGFHITPGDFKSLAAYIKQLAEDNELSLALSQESRKRAVKLFSQNNQISLIAHTLNTEINKK
jgi:glycosyltransferase involved in cell wall biosynthesis